MQTFLFALSTVLSLVPGNLAQYQPYFEPYGNAGHRDSYGEVRHHQSSYQQPQHQSYQQPSYKPSYQQESYQEPPRQAYQPQQQVFQPSYKPAFQPSYQPAPRVTYQKETYRTKTYRPAYQPAYETAPAQQSYDDQGYQTRTTQSRRTIRRRGSVQKAGGYGHSSHRRRSHAVVHKKTKKQKIISIDKGLYIAGGTQAFGKFKSLKSCMKACAVSSACFAGDYNPWLGKCYFHSNTTACNTMSTHSKLTHFKKIPCTVPGAPRSRLVLGAQLFGAVEQKGIKSFPACLKKCINAGSGISATPTALALFGQGGQVCFGIDYDFSTHKCFFHVANRRRAGTAASALCPETANTAIFIPTDLVPNPAVIHILVCPTA